MYERMMYNDRICILLLDMHKLFLGFIIVLLVVVVPVSAKTKQSPQDIQFNKVCLQIVKEVQRGKKKIPEKLAIDPKNVKSGFQSAYKTALRDITTKQENLRRSKRKVDWVRKEKLTESGVKELCKMIIATLLQAPPPPPLPPPPPGPKGGASKQIPFPEKIEKVIAEQLHKNYEDSPHRYTIRVFGDAAFQSVFDDPEVNVRFVMPCGYFVNSKGQKVSPIFLDREGKLRDDFGDTAEWRYTIPGECAEAFITIQIVDVKSGVILTEKGGIEISWF